jgi:hypothetical protein
MRSARSRRKGERQNGIKCVRACKTDSIGRGGSGQGRSDARLPPIAAAVACSMLYMHARTFASASSALSLSESPLFALRMSEISCSSASKMRPERGE